MTARVLLSQPIEGKALERLASVCQLEVVSGALTAAALQEPEATKQVVE